MILDILTLIILLVLSAFFSAAEVAFISLSNAKIATMKKKNIPRVNIIQKLKSRPRRLLITILIGNNIVNIASASLATLLATDIFESAVLGITTGIMTLLILFFGEIIPKSYASNHNKKFTIFSAPLLQLVQWLLYPLVIIFEWLSHLLAGKHREEIVSEEEVKALAQMGVIQGTIEHDEKAMLERLFALNDLTAEDVMMSRGQIITIQQSVNIESAAALISNSTFTRYPVIDKHVDNIIGFVHARDVLSALEDDRENDTIQSIIHPIIRVNKKERLDSLLRSFQRENVHMAAVTDSHGKTLGIVTLEDVLEEIVGEITDEHDRP